MKIERVSYSIDWAKFKPGYSFFVPCLYTPEARREVLKVARRLKMKVLIKVVIEEGVKGLRVWRV
jgi:hypothetical protein